MSTGLPPIWIGDRYSTGGVFRRRVLLVGESTYAPPGVDTSQYNRLIPLEHMDGSCRDGYRTRLIRMLLGIQEESPTQIADAWQSVAFFNYIAKPLAGPGEAPSEMLWLHFHQPLDQHICELRPEIVLLLSYRLWDRLTGRGVLVGRQGPILQGAGRPNTLRVAVGGGGEAIVYGVKHPSYLSWRSEHSYFQRLLSTGVPSSGEPKLPKPRLLQRRPLHGRGDGRRGSIDRTPGDSHGPANREN